MVINRPPALSSFTSPSVSSYTTCVTAVIRRVTIMCKARTIVFIFTLQYTLVAQSVYVFVSVCKTPAFIVPVHKYLTPAPLQTPVNKYLTPAPLHTPVQEYLTTATLNTPVHTYLTLAILHTPVYKL